MKRPFAVIGLTAFFTVAALFDMETGAVAAVFAALVVSFAISLSIRKIRENGAAPCALAAGASACLLLLGATLFTYYPALSCAGETREACLTVLGDVQERRGKYYYPARIETAGGEKLGVKARLVLIQPRQIEPYDRLEGVFKFYALGASSEEALLFNKARGVFLGARPVGGNEKIVKIPESQKPFSKKILNARKAIKDSIFRALPNENGALAAALALGDRSGLSERTSRAFNRAGITHIVCVSGLHMGLWSSLILTILRKTRIGEKAASLLACAGTAAFMLVTGLAYSVVRSGIMTLVFLFGNIISRRRDALNSLGFALTAITVLDPFAIGSTSLKLSALSTLGVISYSSYVLPEIEKFFDRSKFRKLSSFASKIVSALAITCAASVFAAPLTFKLYGGFNFIILASNLVIIPIAGACMTLCAVGAAVGAILPGVFNFPAFIGGKLAGAIIYLARKFAKMEFLNFPFDSEAADVIVIALIFVVACAALLVGLGKLRSAAASGICAAFFAASVCAFSICQRSETRFRLVACGNGTSVLVSRGGENLLFGCGGDGFFAREDAADATERIYGKFNAIFIPDDGEASSSFLNYVLSRRRPESIYFNDLPDGSSLLLGGVEKRGFSDGYVSKNFSVESYEYENSHCVYIENTDVRAIICFDPGFDFSAVEGARNSADLLIFRSSPPKGTKGNFSVAAINAGDDAGKRFCREGAASFGTRAAAEGKTVVIARDGKLRVKK